MNLKEAFRFQNKLQNLIDHTASTLKDENNVLRTKNTTLHKKVIPTAENETARMETNTEFSDSMTEMAGFLCYLLSQQETLSKAIRMAKAKLPIDMDSELSLNRKRQEIASVFDWMGTLRNSELLVPNAGSGYRFNVEGNQVSYRCDLLRVKTLNFDRKKVCGYQKQLTQKADEISTQIDQCMVNTPVDYTPPFDVNDRFADIFREYLEA